MRAVAVLSVFANHLFGWPTGGFVGVDMFFVLSGFFITGILIRERTATRQLSFKRFYIRRVKRILPSSLLVLVVTVIGGYLLFPATRAKDTLLDALYAAIFGANFRFEAVGADYFQSDQPPSPIQHYWSLSIEEQFYFVWPALIVAIFALTRRYRQRGKRTAGQWGLLAGMGAVVAASFGWALVLSSSDPNAAYFSTFTRVWELGVGALLAIAAPWLANIPSTLRPVLAYLGLAGVAASLFLINESVQFPAPWAALPVLATALVVAAFQGAEVHGMAVLTNPVARWFGDTSYTLYLWHWPVIILLLTIMPKGPLFYALAIALSLGLTALTYRFYENPIRHSDWLLEKKTNTVKDRRLPALTPTVWSGIGAIAAATTLVAILGIGYAERLSVARESASAATGFSNAGTAKGVGQSGNSNSNDPCFGAPAMITPGCVLWNADAPLEPPIDTFAKDSPYAQLEECYRVANEGGELRGCDYGYTGSDAIRIALIGDSHAQSLMPALMPILEANKWRLTTYLGTRCHFADPAPEECEDALEPIRRSLPSKGFDLILSTNYELSLPTSAFQKAWAPLIAAGSRIAVIADNPRTSDEALACLTRTGLNGDRGGDCGRPRGEAVAIRQNLVAATEGVPGSSVIDLTPYYCNTDWCPSVIGNVIVYRDSNHITKTFATTLAPALEGQIRSVVSNLPR
jgi:peptidoglycan/LPS O-acetylase OafA/YrhL